MVNVLSPALEVSFLYLYDRFDRACHQHVVGNATWCVNENQGACVQCHALSESASQALTRILDYDEPPELDSPYQLRPVEEFDSAQFMTYH